MEILQLLSFFPERYSLVYIFSSNRRRKNSQMARFRSVALDLRNLLCQGRNYMLGEPYSRATSSARSIQTKEKFRSKTQRIGSVQPEEFRKDWSTWTLFPVEPVWVLVEWIARSVRAREKGWASRNIVFVVVSFLSFYFCFSFDSTSLAYITIPKKQRKTKITWDKKIKYNIYLPELPELLSSLQYGGPKESRQFSICSRQF